jgi:hypothetical protein
MLANSFLNILTKSQSTSVFNSSQNHPEEEKTAALLQRVGHANAHNTLHSRDNNNCKPYKEAIWYM